MEPRTISYSEVLSALMGMVGDQVEVGVYGADREPPLCASFEGELAPRDAHAGELVGWDRDALNLHVGQSLVTLHPDHFTEAIYSEGHMGLRLLTITMGSVTLKLRAPPAPAD